MEWRLKLIQNKLAQMSLENEDIQILDQIHSLSDVELDALLAKDLESKQK